MLLMNIDSEIKIRTYTQQSCTHTHDYYQWVFPIKGNLELQIGNQLGMVNSNQAALIVPHEKHSFASMDENLFIVLDVKAEKHWMNNINLPSFWSLPSTFKEFLPFALNYLRKNEADIGSYSIVSDFLQKLLMQQLLNVDPAVVKARNWIDSHFSAPIHLKTIAKYCCLSSSQLQRRFKQMMGQSIGEYWRRKRLQQAQLLLNNKAISIEMVANTVGYENLAAFSRSFSQQFLKSPSEWRKMHLSAKKMHLNDKSDDR
jgi:AraC-like DNA-binding protein